MNKKTTIAVATICTLTVVGVLAQAKRKSIHAQRIDVVLKEISVAFREGNVESAQVLCTSDCDSKVKGWMTSVSNDLSSSLGWHPLTDPPQTRNPVIQRVYGTGNVDYFPDAKWGLLSHFGRFYRFRQEDGEWRFAGYFDIVR